MNSLLKLCLDTIVREYTWAYDALCFEAGTSATGYLRSGLPITPVTHPDPT